MASCMPSLCDQREDGDAGVAEQAVDVVRPLGLGHRLGRGVLLVGNIIRGLGSLIGSRVVGDGVVGECGGVGAIGRSPAIVVGVPLAAGEPDDVLGVV